MAVGRYKKACRAEIRSVTRSFQPPTFAVLLLDESRPRRRLYKAPAPGPLRLALYIIYAIVPCSVDNPRPSPIVLRYIAVLHLRAYSKEERSLINFQPSLAYLVRGTLKAENSPDTPALRFDPRFDSYSPGSWIVVSTPKRVEREGAFRIQIGTIFPKA